jgi:Di-sulfide bridge nucleocytoplasmic transport domain
MAVCSKEYLENRCAPNTRVPAMEKACLAWEKCMNRDPTVVGRARVSAETFAEIVNSFIEPISYKTMVPALNSSDSHQIFCLLAVFGSVFLSNFAFGLLRHRDHPQRYLQYQQPPPPQTPVQMPNLVMMSPWNGNTGMGSPQRMGSPRRKTSQKRNTDGE